MLTGVE